MPRPPAALWLCLAALAGGAWAGAEWTSLDWRAGLVAAAGGLALCGLRRAPRALACGVIVAAAAFGYAAAAARTVEGRALEAGATRARSCSFRARVLEQAGGLGTLAALEWTDCTTGPLPAGNVVLVADDPPDSGTVISGRGWITHLGTDSFAAARRAAGARALLTVASGQRTAPSGFWGFVAAIRSSFRSAAASRLEPRQSALLLGLTIGDTEGFAPEDLASFRSVGLTHVLAVSGSNVAIVLGAIAMATRRLAHARRVGSMLGAAAIFVCVVGPDGSVLRAAVMGVVALLAGGWVRPVDPAHSLPFALLLLIAVRPTMVTSAGLHLSVAATLGIVLWSRSLAERMPVLPAPVAGTLGVTLGAQIAVAPILVLLFGRLSAVAPVSNVLAAPAVGVATVLGMCAAVVSLVAAGPAALIASLAGPALAWILTVAEAGAALPWADVAVPRPWGWLLLVSVTAAAARRLARPSAA